MSTRMVHKNYFHGIIIIIITIILESQPYEYKKKHFYSLNYNIIIMIMMIMITDYYFINYKSIYIKKKLYKSCVVFFIFKLIDDNNIIK